MDVRHIWSVALLAIMAVAALFFFPAAHGSYSATHGPITALRAYRLRAFLLFVISSAAAALAAILQALVSIGTTWAEFLVSPLLSSHCTCSPLRC
jgi:hypothetical protein